MGRTGANGEPIPMTYRTRPRKQLKTVRIQSSVNKAIRWRHKAAKDFFQLPAPVWRFFRNAKREKSSTTLGVTWSTVNWRGNKTDLFFAGSKNAKKKILIIPGNPGSADWYAQFALSMAEKDSSLGIYGLSLLGHSLRVDNGRKMYDVEDQIRIANKVAKKISANVFMGHSFGAHVCKEILERNPELKERSAIVLLMPLSHCRQAFSESVKFMVNPNFRDLVVKTVLVLTGLIPKQLWKLIHPLSGFNQISREILWLSAGCYPLFRNILNLALDEGRKIHELSLPLLGSMSNRVHYYHVQDDKWDTKEAYQRFVDNLPDASVVDDTVGTQHAFVLADEEVETVAQSVVDFLEATPLKSAVAEEQTSRQG